MELKHSDIVIRVVAVLLLATLLGCLAILAYQSLSAE